MSTYSTPRSNPESISSTPADQRSLQSQKHPCILCQQRKVKCDRGIPCANCTKAKVDCVSTDTLPPRKRKKRFSEAELLARLRRYEEHLKALGADITAINEGAPVPNINKRLPLQGQRRTIGRDEDVPLRHTISNGLVIPNEDFQSAEDLLQGSSDDEIFETPISKSYDEFYTSDEDFLSFKQPIDNLLNAHPPTVQIFQLWQIFLDSVNPLTRIFHAPTVQSQILEASSDLSRVSKEVEALMFGIYSVAVYSLSPEECKKRLNQDRDILLRQYHTCARHALHQAELLKTSSITVLQAFALYLLSCLFSTVDPRTLSCLTGISIRIAQRMGLQYDGADQRLPPFETEMRRRLWWQLVLLDNRVTDLSGAGSLSLTYDWRTKYPSNVNDSDLSPGMKDSPNPQPGVSEMIFVQQRCHVLQLTRRPEMVDGAPETRNRLIDEMENDLHLTSMPYVDYSVPLHSLAMNVTRQSINKLKMGQKRPKSMLVGLAHGTEQEKESSFLKAMSVLEIHNQMLRDSDLKRFRWFLYTHFPMPALLFILIALRQRATDELAGQAWIHIAESYDNREGNPFSLRGTSPLHLAIGNLTIKAWETREIALKQVQPHYTVPRFISSLRQTILDKKQKSGNSTAATSPEATSATNNYQKPLEFDWNQQMQDEEMEHGDKVMVSDGSRVYDQMFANNFVMQEQMMTNWGIFDDMVGFQMQQGLNGL